MALARRHKLIGYLALIVVLAIPVGIATMIWSQNHSLRISKLNELHGGMTRAEIYEIIGKPTSTGSGPDNTQAEFFDAADGFMFVLFDADGHSRDL